MVKHVGKRRLEAHSYRLCDPEDFGEAEAGRDCPGALQDANSGVAEASSTGRSGRECGEIEVLRARLTPVEIRRELVGTQESAAVAVALSLHGHKELLGNRGGAAVSFVIEKEERFVLPVVQMRNGSRSVTDHSRHRWRRDRSFSGCCPMS